METGQATATINAPLVLNMSTRGNIPINTNSNGQLPLGLGKRRQNKLPSTITVKTISKGGAGGVKKEKADAMVDIIQLGDPDAENRPPQGGPPQHQQQPQVVMVSRAMTFDQQSQTETKMYDNTMPPATAAQMQQQSQQIAQLIRSNNGLVIEVRQLKESSQAMKEMVVELDRKLIRLLSVVGQDRMTEEEKNVEDDEKQHINFVDVNPSYQNPVEEIIEYGGGAGAGAGDASNDQYSIVYSVGQSQQSGSTRSVKSENTPPLKKNKLKMQQAAEAEAPKFTQSDDEFQVIGVNKTRVPKHILNELSFGNYSSVTRKILVSVFDRETLATHSLTGKPSPGE